MNLNERQREWLAFGALAGVFLLVLLIVAFARPWLFGRAIPAALGLDRPPPAAPTSAPAPIPELFPTPSPMTATPALAATPAATPAVGESQSPTALPTLRYTVRAGDTLSAIAAAHGVSVASLVALNRLENPDRLVPGTELIIPAP